MKKNIIVLASLLFFAQNHSYAMQFFSKWLIARNLKKSQLIIDALDKELINAAKNINKGKNPSNFINCQCKPNIGCFYKNLKKMDPSLKKSQITIEKAKALYQRVTKNESLEKQLSTLEQQTSHYRTVIESCKNTLENKPETKKLLYCKKNHDSPSDGDSGLSTSVSCASSSTMSAMSTFH